MVFLIEDAVPAIRPPGYNPIRQPVSSLAIGPFGWIQVANFLVTGVLLLAFAVGRRPALRRYHGGFWAPVLLGLVAIGLIGARGAFTTDPLSGYPPGTPALPAGATTHGVLHEAFSAQCSWDFPPRAAWSATDCWIAPQMVGDSLGTAAVFLTGFVLVDLPSTPIWSVGGFLQRLTLIAGLAWITTPALHLIRR